MIAGLHSKVGSTVGPIFALAILIGAVSASWHGVARPVLEHFHNMREELERLVLRKAKLEYVLNGAAPTDEKSTSLVTFRGDFNSGDSEAVVAASLQQTIGGMAAGQGVSLISSQVLPAKKLGSYDVITLRLQLSGALDQVHRLLHAIETAQPLLFVDRAVFRADVTRETSEATGIAAVRLIAELDVTGARWTRLDVPGATSR